MPIPGADCSHMLFLPPGNIQAGVPLWLTLKHFSVCRFSARSKRALAAAIRCTLYAVCNRAIISRDVSISRKKDKSRRDKSVIDEQRPKATIVMH